MSEQETFSRGYIKGYEEGLREAMDEFISTTMKRSYTTTEIQLLAKNQRAGIEDKVKGRKRKILRETGIDLNDDGEKQDLKMTFAPKGTYLIKEKERPDQAFKVFSSLVNMGVVGLCISRLPPETAQKRFGDKCTIVWLTKSDPPSSETDPDQKSRDQYISPGDLSRVQSAIKLFLSANKEKPSVILLEGVNLMITNNDFKGFLKMVQKMKDEIFTARSILLIPIEPTTMDPLEFKLLQSELGAI